MLSFKQFIIETGQELPPDPSWMSSESQPRNHPLKAPADIKELGKFHGMNAHVFHPLYANNPHYQDGYMDGAMMIDRIGKVGPDGLTDEEREETIRDNEKWIALMNADEDYRKSTGG